MDNNSAAVAFPDFTRGHWNESQCYTHAYAEDEARSEALAEAYTQAQRRITEQYKLWSLYDALKAARDNGDTAAEALALTKLKAAKQSARKAIAKQVHRTKR